MTWTIRILNWRDYQHYTDRDPPWIKLHQRRLLDKPQWRKLHGSAAKLLVDLWMLAAGTKDGELGWSMPDLAFRLRIDDDEMRNDLKVLQQYDFIDVCKQVIAKDTKRSPEGETEAEQRQKSTSFAPQVENWVIPFAKAWGTRFQGTIPWGRIGKALKPLRENYPDDEILARWSRYLAQARAGVHPPETFAQTFGDWGVTKTPLAPGVSHDVAYRRALMALPIVDAKRIPRNGFPTDEAFQVWLDAERERTA